MNQYREPFVIDLRLQSNEMKNEEGLTQTRVKTLSSITNNLKLQRFPMFITYLNITPSIILSIAKR